MATLTHQCPHCLTEHIALQIVASDERGGHLSVAWLNCPKCRQPSCATLDFARPGTPEHQWHQYAGDVIGPWKVGQFWPQPPADEIPLHVPENVARTLKQAESNFRIKGNEEASGTMYRKTIDLGLKAIDATIKGTLEKRIDKLVDQGRLTRSIGEWAHQIRSLGNDSAHEDTPPSRDEIIALRKFTSLSLQYLFTLPEMVRLAATDLDGEK